VRYPLRPTAESYGHPLGVLLLHRRVPAILGDLANARTYPGTVLLKVISGVTPKTCAAGGQEVEASIVAAAVHLERQGVRAILGSSIHLHRYRSAVDAAVKIPVALSGIDHLRLFCRALGPSRRIGVITAELDGDVRQRIREIVGNAPNPLTFASMEHAPAFRSAVLDEAGLLDSDAIEEEVLSAARALRAEHGDLGGFAFTCPTLSPYAPRVRAELGLPVFDPALAAHHLSFAAHQRRYDGAY
jgi:Asp/Glu/hydantoin racemase